MIGELVSGVSSETLLPGILPTEHLIFLQRADIAVADLTITHKRTEVVDFTVSFMNTGEN